MIHITAQMRVLVAIEPVDGRKGIDSLVGYARKSFLKILFPAAFLFLEVAVERRFVSSAMTARDTTLRRSVSPKDGSRGGRNRPPQPSSWRLMKRSC